MPMLGINHTEKYILSNIFWMKEIGSIEQDLLLKLEEKTWFREKRV